MLMKIIIIVIAIMCILSSMQAVTRMSVIVGLKSRRPNLNITTAAPDTTTSGCNVQDDGKRERDYEDQFLTLKPKHISQTLHKRVKVRKSKCWSVCEAVQVGGKNNEADLKLLNLRWRLCDRHCLHILHIRVQPQSASQKHVTNIV